MQRRLCLLYMFRCSMNTSRAGYQFDKLQHTSSWAPFRRVLWCRRVYDSHSEMCQYKGTSGAPFPLGGPKHFPRLTPPDGAWGKTFWTLATSLPKPFSFPSNTTPSFVDMAGKMVTLKMKLLPCESVIFMCSQWLDHQSRVCRTENRKKKRNKERLSS